MPFTVLVAPSGFKESLGARHVADAISTGVVRGFPGVRILKAPMVDGGEGTVEALVEATSGTLRHVTVTGPLGTPVSGFYGILGGPGPRTAVIEIAAAAGLSLVPRDRRDPTRTTSRGVGELIGAALAHDINRILIGCGDSGVSDAGAGMLQALGARLLDRDMREIGPGGGELCRLARIDVSGLDRRLASVQIDAAVNWHNVLLGERGVARVYGPQKGARRDQVATLEVGLANFASVVRRDLGRDFGAAPGTGASGGLGAAILAVLGGRLHPRYEIVMPFLAFDDLLAEADLVLTAEGGLDGQTPFGKIPAEVGTRAARLGVPVIALAGTVAEECSENLHHGVSAFVSILRRPCSLEDAMSDTHRLLVAAAEQTLRMVRVGVKLGHSAALEAQVRQTCSAGLPTRDSVGAGASQAPA